MTGAGLLINPHLLFFLSFLLSLNLPKVEGLEPSRHFHRKRSEFWRLKSAQGNPKLSIFFDGYTKIVLATGRTERHLLLSPLEPV